MRQYQLACCISFYYYLIIVFRAATNSKNEVPAFFPLSSCSSQSNSCPSLGPGETLIQFLLLSVALNQCNCSLMSEIMFNVKSYGFGDVFLIVVV
jgi:hypothetical protein